MVEPSADVIYRELMIVTDPVVPPIVYLPCSPESTEDQLHVEKRELDDGGVGLLAFTALDRLLDGCGPDQPWAVYPTESLADLKPYSMIVLDAQIPLEARHGRSDG
ncbi:MAG: hypothetical protein L0H93_08310 [Nocardioides sp.]|nr:hypothetical protein [Nocardioides sp.]